MTFAASVVVVEQIDCDFVVEVAVDDARNPVQVVVFGDKHLVCVLKSIHSFLGLLLREDSPEELLVLQLGIGGKLGEDVLPQARVVVVFGVDLGLSYFADAIELNGGDLAFFYNLVRV